MGGLGAWNRVWRVSNGLLFWTVYKELASKSVKGNEWF